jgi:glutamine amidotransferase
MIIIVDYGMGNVGSILSMGKKAGAEIAVSGDPEVIGEAEKLILPGVGAFDNGMKNLHERGLVPVLNRQVVERGVPILGICLGVQLFTRGSEEGKRCGLGWIAADTLRFEFPGGPKGLKVPHMGWNFVEPAKTASLLEGLPPEPRFYFVHSYYVACDDPSDVLCWTTYGHRFASAIQRGNVFGTQFHPEKSHRFGLAVLKSFARLA